MTRVITGGLMPTDCTRKSCPSDTGRPTNYTRRTVIASLRFHAMRYYPRQVNRSLRALFGDFRKASQRPYRAGLGTLTNCENPEIPGDSPQNETVYDLVIALLVRRGKVQNQSLSPTHDTNFWQVNMLQINSEKMFVNETEERNRLRGVLHTNLRILESEPIETAIGSILPVTNLRDPKTMVYELTERFEKNPPVAANLHSHGVDPYLKEAATLISFALNVTCTPDYQLTQRLLGPRPNLMGDAQPKELLSRVFDEQVWAQTDEIEELVKFAARLIGLGRKRHLATIRAINTYVTGVHRVADDYELAYTLMVAAIESLAQKFDGHQPEWNDYPEEKRNRIDDALAGADPLTTEKVKQAILDIEHTALARRFREFTVDHLRPEYYQQASDQGSTPVTEALIRRAVQEAYNIRSGYLHTLRRMPNEIKIPGQLGKIAAVGRKTYLTFEGLSQMVRHVITEFVNRGPQVETEDYNYHPERFDLVRVRPDHLPTGNAPS